MESYRNVYVELLHSCGVNQLGPVWSFTVPEDEYHPLGHVGGRGEDIARGIGHILRQRSVRWTGKQCKLASLDRALVSGHGRGKTMTIISLKQGFVYWIRMINN